MTKIFCKIVETAKFHILAVIQNNKHIMEDIIIFYAIWNISWVAESTWHKNWVLPKKPKIYKPLRNSLVGFKAYQVIRCIIGRPGIFIKLLITFLISNSCNFLCG